MNDLVFVMHNLKLKEKNDRKNDCSVGFTVDDLSSDDEWIVEEEDMFNSSNEDLLNILSAEGREKDDEDMEDVGALIDLESHGSKSQDDLEIQDIDVAEDQAQMGNLEDMDTIGSTHDVDIDDDHEDDDDEDRDGRGHGSFDDLL